MNRIVIVGASLAGIRTLESLRAEGFTGEVVLIGDETGEPYDRPPLSKQYLAGNWDAERIQLSSWSKLVGNDATTVHVGVQATGISLDQQTVQTSIGPIPFDGLVIATGARARRLAGTEHLDCVHVVRTKADADRLQPHLVESARVVVVGAGFIGAEVAATAKGKGCEVTVLEALPTPLIRQLGEEMGAAVAAVHERKGVALHTNANIAAIGDEGVRLVDGTLFPADVVVVGVGALPNVEWLSESGLQMENGIRCNESLQVLSVDGSVTPNIVAVGDVASWPNHRYQLDGQPEVMRIEHWTNAAESAMHAAKTLLGQPSPYEPVPYFWSDQYDAKVQFLGRTTGFDEVRVVEGSVADGSWLALYRKDQRLVGVLGVTKMRSLMRFRALLVTNASWAEALEKAGVA